LRSPSRPGGGSPTPGRGCSQSRRRWGGSRRRDAHPQFWCGRSFRDRRTPANQTHRRQPGGHRLSHRPLMLHPSVHHLGSRSPSHCGTSPRAGRGRPNAGDNRGGGPGGHRRRASPICQASTVALRASVPRPRAPPTRPFPSVTPAKPRRPAANLPVPGSPARRARPATPHRRPRAPRRRSAPARPGPRGRRASRRVIAPAPGGSDRPAQLHRAPTGGPSVSVSSFHAPPPPEPVDGGRPHRLAGDSVDSAPECAHALRGNFRHRQLSEHYLRWCAKKTRNTQTSSVTTKSFENSSVH
jgi:hypothetical protein